MKQLMTGLYDGCMQADYVPTLHSFGARLLDGAVYIVQLPEEH